MRVLALAFIATAFAVLSAPDIAAQPRSLFAPVPDSVVGVLPLPVPDAARGDGVLRSRLAVLDLGVLESAVSPGPGSGRPPVSVLFNLFEDAALAVAVDSVGTPALSAGYVLSGSTPDGVGAVVVVVYLDADGGVSAVSGSVSSDLGFFSISSTGSATVLVQQLDPAVSRFDEALEVPESAVPAAPPLGFDPGPEAAAGPSTIDILVVFTVLAESDVGGRRSMFALIDRLVAETNQAFRNGGVSTSLNLVGARPLEDLGVWIEHLDVGDDLKALALSDDGLLDGVHPLRDELGADLVHMLGYYPDDETACARAYRPSTLPEFWAAWGFGATDVSRCSDWYTFTHEIGHNLGLPHDRGTHFGSDRGAGLSVSWRPWAYGFTNASSFDPAVDSWCWATIMGYAQPCYDAGYQGVFPRLLWFSSPYQHAGDDPIGEFGEVETYAAIGPAHATRALEESRSYVAAYRGGPASTPTRLQITGPTSFREGAEARFRLDLGVPAPAGGVLWELWWKDGTAVYHVDYDNPGWASGLIEAGDTGASFSFRALSDDVADTGETFTLWVTTVDPALRSADFTVTIEDVPPVRRNRAPRVGAALPSLDLLRGGSETTVPLAGAFTDPDGDALSYTVRSSSPSIVSVRLSAVAAASVRPLAAGSTFIRVTATDSGGLSASQSFQVRVAYPPIPPFSDHPARAGLTSIRAVHMRELRSAADELRSRRSLPAFRWTDPVLTPGSSVLRAVHFREIREALEGVYRALGRTAPVWTDPVLVPGRTPVRAVHLNEIRRAVRQLE